ncbi:MAG: 5'/3'-nucleotidase SurE, partial [Muribaculaceae bacterium]|nr:5'/3'-nucleotidase SurE [Muribaculaceae bacterium]
RKLILIANDDGVHAPGLHRLVEAVAPLGDVVVVAPDGPRSGQSSAMTVNGPLRVEVHAEYDNAKVFSVSGTPVDCIKIAMNNILKRRPDIVLAGINHGSNAGVNILYSGPMGAVLEGCLQGIPAVGFSLLHHSIQADFSQAMPLARMITEKVLANGLPHDVCLNVNFPAKVTIEGVKVVRAARSHWTEEYQTYTDPHGKPFYWLTGGLVNEEPDATDTDLYWLDRNYATVVPSTTSQNAPDAIGLVADFLK